MSTGIVSSQYDYLSNIKNPGQMNIHKQPESDNPDEWKKQVSNNIAGMMNYTNYLFDGNGDYELGGKELLKTTEQCRTVYDINDKEINGKFEDNLPYRDLYIDSVPKDDGVLKKGLLAGIKQQIQGIVPVDEMKRMIDTPGNLKCYEINDLLVKLDHDKPQDSDFNNTGYLIKTDICNLDQINIRNNASGNLYKLKDTLKCNENFSNINQSMNPILTNTNTNTINKIKNKNKSDTLIKTYITMFSIISIYMVLRCLHK
jgi:hypothetical protein